MSLDARILLLCLTPKTSGEIVDALGTRTDLAGLALAYTRLVALSNKRLLGRRVEVRDSQRVTVWTTKVRNALRSQPQSVKAVLGALGPTPQTTTQVAHGALLRHDTTLAILTALAKAGIVVHTRDTKKTSPHLWALAMETT